MGDSWTCSGGVRGSLSVVADALLRKMAALTVFVAEERGERFTTEQEWMVCFSGYHQGQLEKRMTVCFSKPCKIICTHSTHLTPIHGEKQNLRAQNACTYTHAHKAHAKSMYAGLAAPFATALTNYTET